ncbi:unnamed protein product [Urochloa humidicola]
MAAQPHDHAPPPPEFPDDIVREFLVRLPPDEPGSLLCAGAVCRPWLRILCDPHFRGYYREFHRLPGCWSATGSPRPSCRRRHCGRPAAPTSTPSTSSTPATAACCSSHQR